MSKSIVTETIEIWVSRDFDVYTHKIYRDGVLASDETIDAQRAAQIILANPNGSTRGQEPINFEPGAKQFTWIVEIDEGVDDGD